MTRSQLSSMVANHDVSDVLALFKCHLDVGFTNTAAHVLRQYFNEYFPQAIRVADELRADSGREGYVWTMPAWLVYEYLETATPSARTVAEEAIQRGALSWHALPFNWFSELLDVSATRTALRLSASLDTRFDRRTRVGRFTDVPGHTRGLIAPLVDAGIEFLDIGMNPGCRPPQVPIAGYNLLAEQRELELPDPDSLGRNEASSVYQDFEAPAAELARLSTEGWNEIDTAAFRWRDTRDNELVVLYHLHSYGSTVRVPHTGTVASIRIRGDNFGPHSVESVKAAFRELERKFPGADIRATDLSPIGEAFLSIKEQLPLLTSEIGDSWIYGAASDPGKTAGLRSMLRLRKSWIESGRLVEGGPDDIRTIRMLALAPEHTWGLNTGEYLRARDSFLPSELEAARSDDVSFATMDREWEHKHDIVRKSIEQMPPELQDEARDSLDETLGRSPDLRRFDESTSVLPAILRNDNLLGAGDLFTPGGQLELIYETFDVSDYRRFAGQYNLDASFTPNDFGKPGLENYRAISQATSASVVEWRVAKDSRSVLARLAFLPLDVDVESGHPREVWVELHPDGGGLSIDLNVLGKRATQMPEALWLAVSVVGTGDAGWVVRKVGETVDPRDVVDDAGRMMHAVESVEYDSETLSLRITPLDSPLVSMGRRALLHFDNEPVRPSRGTNFNLHNNLWGTAFPQWYEGDMRFRFEMSAVLHDR